MSMIYKDKHLNYFVAGVPNLNIKFFKSKRCLAREKEDKKMAKRPELKCPLCGAGQMRVKNCKETEFIGHGGGASCFSR